MSISQQPTPAAIGRYRILRPIGSGAMGDVYLAVDPHIDRQLAIKTVRVVGGSAQDVSERSDRLLREARAAGKLLHPNVVALFDADRVDGILYLAFEYVAGTDLAQRVSAEPPLTLRQVLDIARQVAVALDYAHQHGIVHRDIKPSNILISESGRAKVADFGIAKLHGSTELTRTGSVVGSPQYMSPEQVRGEPLDGRSDLFSLGVLLYELLCRLRPFGGDTLSTLVFEILAKEPPTVDELRPGLPATLVALVHRLLAKDRDHRSPSAAAVVASLDAIISETPTGLLEAPAVGDSQPSERTVRMASSSEVPPPPMAPNPPPYQTSTSTLGPSLPGPSSALPLALSSKPGLPPLPPPAGPPSGPSHLAGEPLAPSPIPTVVSGRRSPLDTGPQRVPRSNKAIWVALAVLLPLALVAGLFLARWLPNDSSVDSPAVGAETEPAVEGEGDETGSDPGNDTSAPSTLAADGDEASAPPSATAGPGEDPASEAASQTPSARLPSSQTPPPATAIPAPVTPPPRAATPPALLFPGGYLVLASLGFVLMGEQLREAFDPRFR